MSGAPTVLSLPTGLTVASGPLHVQVPPLELTVGQWAVLVPPTNADLPEPATDLARRLGTLGMPTRGTIELLGYPIATLTYAELMRLRSHVGYVPHKGGLLANRTIADNLALPLSIHARLGSQAEAARVRELLEQFELSDRADKRPHQLDPTHYFRALLARALTLRPQWLVVEGSGDFDSDTDGDGSWPAIRAWCDQGQAAAVAVLARRHARFESWATRHGARLVEWAVSEWQVAANEVRA